MAIAGKGDIRDRLHPSAARGGVPGVLIAACLVKSLPRTSVRWLAMAVMLFSAEATLRCALKADREGSGNP